MCLVFSPSKVMNSKCPNELPWNGNVFFVRFFFRITRDNPTRCGRRSRDSPLENHRNMPWKRRHARIGTGREVPMGPWGKTMENPKLSWMVMEDHTKYTKCGWFRMIWGYPNFRKPRKPPTHRNSCFLSIIHCCLTKKRWHFSNRNVFITDRKLWISLSKRLRRCGFSHGFFMVSRSENDRIPVSCPPQQQMLVDFLGKSSMASSSHPMFFLGLKHVKHG